MSMGLARDIEELYVTGDKEEKRGIVVVYMRSIIR
jgi:hypothetical protein